MFNDDDRHTAKPGDRFITAVIGGLFGYFIGWFFALLALKFLGSGYGLHWLFATGFAGFGFIAPARSTEIWSSFWEELLGLLSSRK